MNYINHLSTFFDIAEADNRLTPYHISLYVALFRKWNNAFFKNPLSIARTEISAMAKIGSFNTYAKCLNQLHQWGYIKYEPSCNPLKGSLVNLYTFDTASVANPIQVVRPYTNDTNIKQECLGTPRAQQTLFSVSNSKPAPPNTQRFVIPPFDHVKIYFAEKESSENEAEKFFNYFQSNGWLVGGKAKMKDWKAAARNWMLNAQKFNQSKKQTSLNATALIQNKNYAEPL